MSDTVSSLGLAVFLLFCMLGVAVGFAFLVRQAAKQRGDVKPQKASS